MSKKKELLSDKTPFFVIELPMDEFHNLEYYKTECERLNKRIQGFKDQVNKILDKKEYIKALEGFRKLLSPYCIINTHTITIIQCGNKIANKKCKFNTTCKGRLSILENILANNL